MSLGQNIKKARNKAKLSQEQLANKINSFFENEDKDSSIGNTAVSNWENDLNKPDPDTIRYICKITNVDPNTLLEFNINDSNDDENIIDTDLASKHNNNNFDEIEILFNKNKKFLTDDDKETIKFILEKARKNVDKMLDGEN